MYGPAGTENKQRREETEDQHCPRRWDVDSTGALGELWTVTSLADQRRKSTSWLRDFKNVFKHELGLKHSNLQFSKFRKNTFTWKGKTWEGV